MAAGADTALFWLKIFFAASIGLVGLVGTLLPSLLGRRGTSPRVLALTDTFAGGVLGGAGLIHLLGAGISGFHAALPHFGYPLALLLAGAGFLLILLIEGVLVRKHPNDVATTTDEGAPAIQHETHWHTGELEPLSVPLVLLAVLSVHSVILGLALGAQRATGGAVIVFLAIIAHKGAAGFALGTGYARAGYERRRALPHVSFFSAMTPLGIVLGALVASALTGRADTLFEATFDSIGAGTFIYIAALDIIRTEFDSPEDHAWKWVSAVVGFGIMAVLAIWI